MTELRGLEYGVIIGIPILFFAFGIIQYSQSPVLIQNFAILLSGTIGSISAVGYILAKTRRRIVFSSTERGLLGGINSVCILGSFLAIPALQSMSVLP